MYHDNGKVSSASQKSSSVAGRLKPLPVLRRDMPVQKRLALFKQKLELCTVVYDFSDPSTDRAREQKRQTLMELINYINTPTGQKQLFTEAMMPLIVEMLSTNTFRELPPTVPNFDPEEDEPLTESSWPHLAVVYEYMLRFIVSNEVRAKSSRKFLHKSFCKRLILLFKSGDPRERDYLKTILHRIYGKFTGYRSLIRRELQYTFYQFVFERQPHNGIGELLEILGSIINGFALPLKKEHLVFLNRALLPLHKPRSVQLYHMQLTYCMTQYAEKSPLTAVSIVLGIIKFWPWTCSSKQILFFNELEDVLEILTNDQVQPIDTLGPYLFAHLAKCMGSAHFQVQERCLYLWSNENLVNRGCLGKQYCSTSLPCIYAPLSKLSKGHWHPTVQGLAQNVIKTYMGYNLKFFNKISSHHLGTAAREQHKEQQRQQWQRLQSEFAEKHTKAQAEREKKAAEAITGDATRSDRPPSN